MKRKKMISASLICADLGNISECVRDLEKNHIEYLHMDIFDGHFVKNLGFPPEVIKTVRGLTNIPFDFHFCVEEPMNFLTCLILGGGDYVSIDYNTTKNIYKTLQTIQEIGAKPSISLSPSTSLCVLDYLWDVIDMIMIMTVSPGMAGQKLTITLEKLKICGSY